MSHDFCFDEMTIGDLIKSSELASRCDSLDGLREYLNFIARFTNANIFLLNAAELPRLFKAYEIAFKEHLMEAIKNA